MSDGKKDDVANPSAFPNSIQAPGTVDAAALKSSGEVHMVSLTNVGGQLYGVDADGRCWKREGGREWKRIKNPVV